MKFYIASSLKNIENVRQVAENLKARGFQHTYDWTTHSNVDSITLWRSKGATILYRSNHFLQVVV